jgi:hypothetical protein
VYAQINNSEGINKYKEYCLALKNIGVEIGLTHTTDKWNTLFKTAFKFQTNYLKYTKFEKIIPKNLNL